MMRTGAAMGLLLFTLALPWSIGAETESTTIPPSTALLRNARFDEWEAETPKSWQASGGATVQKVPDGHPTFTTLEMKCSNPNSDGLFNQDMSFLKDHIVSGDLVHVDLLISCTAADAVFVELVRGYPADAPQRWRPLRSLSAANGDWKRVSVDWLVSDADLENLQLISFGVRVLRSTETTVRIADPRAWLANTGLD